jgi:hypothetical protein
MASWSVSTITLCALFVFEPLQNVYAQQVSAGIRIGGTFTDEFRNTRGLPTYTAVSERFLIGPSLRVRTHSGAGFEIAAVHKNFSYRYAFGRGGLGRTDYDATASMWQFPLLAQYGHRFGPVLPYLSVGPSLRMIGSAKAKGETCTSLPSVSCTPFSQSDVPEVDSGATLGFVAGGGMEIPFAFLRLSPELRFTRWHRSPFKDSLVETRAQIEFLLRVAIPVRGSRVTYR